MTGPRAAAAETAPRVAAVLFDLDDTLFDHRHCAQSALARVHDSHACFQPIAFEEFARAHGRLLEELHGDVMLGRVDVDTARIERFRRLFLGAGVRADNQLVRQTAANYRTHYVAARRSIEGAAELLAKARQRARIVIVSNNILEEQREKLRQCDLERFIDVLVVSEEVGVSKPEPQIFHEALRRAGSGADEAVMIGDSWTADVIGARAAGIRAVWFNPLGLTRPDPAPGVAELRSLRPVDAALRVIFRDTPAEAYANRD